MKETEMNSVKNRNISLDLIKCIACIGVVGLHSVGMVNYTIYYLCGISVPMFFMVNGFLMFSKEKIDYKYSLIKILQLVKIIVLWNMIMILPVIILRHKLINPITQCLKSVLQQGYLWHFWFFGALILIYLLLPILHGLLKDRLMLHLIACIILGIICVGISVYSMIAGYSLVAYVPQTLRLWTWLFFYLFGGLCQRINITDMLTANFNIYVHGGLLVIVAIINNIAIKKIGVFLTHTRIADYYYDNFSSILFYTLIFTLLLRIKLKDKASYIVQKLAPLTMGIFILHPLLLKGITSVINPQTTTVAIVIWFALIISCGIASAVIRQIPCVKELIKL